MTENINSIPNLKKSVYSVTGWDEEIFVCAKRGERDPESVKSKSS